MSKTEKLKTSPYFVTTLRGMETIVYDRYGKPHKLWRLRRYKKPLIYEEISLKRNPDKIRIANLGHGVSLIRYKNSPDKFFLTTPRDIICFDRYETKCFMRASCQLGNFFEVLLPFEAHTKHNKKRNPNSTSRGK